MTHAVSAFPVGFDVRTSWFFIPPCARHAWTVFAASAPLEELEQRIRFIASESLRLAAEDVFFEPIDREDSDAIYHRLADFATWQQIGGGRPVMALDESIELVDRALHYLRLSWALQQASNARA